MTTMPTFERPDTSRYAHLGVSPSSEVVRVRLLVCPTCKGVVALRDDGELFAHQRYADGCGSGPEVPHDLIECEGEASERAWRGIVMRPEATYFVHMAPLPSERAGGSRD